MGAVEIDFEQCDTAGGACYIVESKTTRTDDKSPEGGRRADGGSALGTFCTGGVDQFLP